MLYNIFRPKQFKDVCGQEHITSVLLNQCRRNQPAHAYLLCGNRGSGKTTCAKILSKAVNCLTPKDGEPCGECEMCKKIDKGLCCDVVELDAASNNSVDDIRGIIETLKYPTSEAKYKVFIIDEVHMLSTGASNAFLKTLEEPPENVIFILATTDPQKLPITILSRCQRFEFKRIKREIIFNNLKLVSQKANIKIDDNGLSLISKVCDGAMRDALSILDQVSSSVSSSEDTIKYESLLEILGVAKNDILFSLVKFLISNDSISALDIIQSLDNDGKDFLRFTKDTILFLRNLLIAKTMGEKAKNDIAMADEDILKLLEISKAISKENIIYWIKIFQEKEAQMKNSSQLRIIYELAIIQITERNKKENTYLKQLNDLDKKISLIVSKSSCNITPNNINCSDAKTIDNNNSNSEANQNKDACTKLNIAKKDVVNKLKEVNKENFIQLSQVLEKSTIASKGNMSKIYITPPSYNNEFSKKILINGLVCLEKGFSTILKAPLEIIII